MGTVINGLIQDVAQLFRDVDLADIELRMQLNSAKNEARILLTALRGMNQMINGGTGLHRSPVEFMNMAEEVIFQIELSRTLDAMFPYNFLLGERRVCWDTLEEVLGRPAEDISLAEYAVIASIIVSIECDRDFEKFLIILANNEGSILYWGANQNSIIANDDVRSLDEMIWSFCPDKIGNIQRILQHSADMNLGMIMFAELDGEQRDELINANERIFERIGLLTAAKSLTPITSGTPPYGFDRRVVQGDANGPGLSIHRDRDGSLLISVPTLIISSGINMRGDVTRSISSWPQPLEMSMTAILRRGSGVDYIMNNMEYEFLSLFGKDPSLEKAIFKDLAKKIFAKGMKKTNVPGLVLSAGFLLVDHVLASAEAEQNRNFIESSFARGYTANISGEFLFDMIIVDGNTVLKMPTRYTYRMVDELNNVIYELRNSDCPDTANLMDGFPEEITVNDFTNGNVIVINEIYHRLLTQEERDRIYDARKD